MKKRILSALLAAVLLSTICAAPVSAYGGEEAPPDDLFELEEASEYGDIAISDDTSSGGFLLFSSAPDDLVQDGGTGLPSAWDPREEYTLPAVRDQGSWNTCWLVAATAAAEFNLLGAGNFGSIDYSERHLVYFLTHAADDPLGNSTGDYNTDENYWISYGGNPLLATMALASWHGIASESATGTPYSGLSASDSISSSYAYTDELHLENTYAIDLSDASGCTQLKNMILEYGSAVLCMYYTAGNLYAGYAPAEEDDAGPTPTAEPTPTPTAEPTATPVPTAEVTPTPVPSTESDPTPDPDPTPDAAAEEDTETADGTEETDAEPVPVPDTVSLDGTAEMADIEIAETEPAQDGTTEETGDYIVCYYQDSSTGTNHEVLVVGWDDDYPAENFGYSSNGSVPPGDGAWLCRNSYGGTWAGGDGYFWLSYYDKSVSYATKGTINGARAVVFDMGSADNYDNNYEYDGSAVMGYINDSVTVGSDTKYISLSKSTSSTRRWYANIFTASACEPRGNEILRAVSTYAYRAGVPYTVSVYTDLKDLADPTSGTLAVQQSGTFDLAGFRTITLNNTVTLKPGETFSVVIEIAPADDGTLFVPAAYTLSSWRSVNASAAGQSFVSADGDAWSDCYDLNRQGNVRIKAYTDTVAPAAFPFTDVTEDAWYYEAVREAWYGYLIEGMDETTFAPAESATRAQFLMMLWRMAGEPEPETTENPFEDVADDAWYTEVVLWGSENGLITGSDDDGDGTPEFRPDSTITRQELVVILFRYARQNGLNAASRNNLKSFSDTQSVASWALTAEQWSVAVGLQQGVENVDGTFALQPTKAVTRAMLVTYIQRLKTLAES